MHMSSLVQDLSIILMAAAVITLTFRAIRQPVVLGYIIAGFLVGPHFAWFPTVVDSEGVNTWAEIGVIFLLFALGLEFSIKKLARVGASAAITAVIEVAGMVGVGFLLGGALGWNSMDSLFLGGMLAISSTTIIIRAFDELGVKGSGFARVVFGVLIVEDLIAILLMVILSTVAVSQKFSGVELAFSSLKIGFFLTLSFVLGIFIIPSFLKAAGRYMHQETLLIVSVGLCFLMVVLAAKAGFSPALGAFIMGSILSETLESERIEHMIQPLKDLFGAIFFVSVGMLIDPKVLIEFAMPIAVITAVTLVGKMLTTTLGAILSGQNLQHSVKVGMSLAQIGEFSFIIAGLGLSLKVTGDHLYPIAVSVSAITTFTTPYLIRSSDSVAKALHGGLPRTWLARLDRFHASSISEAHADVWLAMIRQAIFKMLANGVIITAVFLAVAEYVDPWMEAQLGGSGPVHTLNLALAFAASAPFLWALTFGLLDGGSGAVFRKQRRHRVPVLILQLSGWVLSLLLCASLSSLIVSSAVVAGGAYLLNMAVLFALSRPFQAVYLWLENRFVQNLSEKDAAPND